MSKILLIDDDKDILFQMRFRLKKEGHTVTTLERGDDVIKVINETGPDLVITDIMMPGVTGGTVYEMIREAFGPGIPIIISSAMRMKLKHNTDHLLAYCPKPMDYEDLFKTVETLLGASEADMD